MSKNRFRMLRELMQRQEDEAAEAMGACIRRHRDAEEKRDLLERFRSEYEEKLRQALRDAAPPELIVNHRGFLARLDEALMLQHTELERLRHLLEESRRAWLAARTRRRAFEVLETRADAEAMAQAERLAQKALDEHATQNHLRREREF
ncbi:flagellar export protein FliJ [Tepidiphilus baoligensis]|uniref:Flagellar FliJ protein n=1 Tax=Tepidiphilus baoligensis TaxID=2698687 RepID=A0ABX1QN25_9PROT|nr:flagellar export protein FliJ [Tepidiphilus baoligensis]NMH16695.1 flagellar export protein FliJ [Tepidiphilus baoligensis]